MKLYRTEKKILDSLTPKKLHYKEYRRPELREYQDTEVIWLTSNIDYSLAFGIFMFSDESYRWGVSYEKIDGKHEIWLGFLNWREAMDLDSKIYLYEFNIENPVHIFKHEYISLDPLRPISIKEYDVRKVLQNYRIYEPKLVEKI